MNKKSFAWVIVILLLSINITVCLVKPGSSFFMKIFGNLFTVLTGILAVLGTASAYASFKAGDNAKKSWSLLLFGISLFLIAECVYAFMELILKMDMENTFPLFSDIFYTLAYIPILMSLTLFLSNYRKSGLPWGNWKKALIPAGVAIFLITLIMIIFVFIPIIKDAKTGILAKAVYFYYPIADILLLIHASILVYITGLFGKGSFSQPWKFISLGFVFLTGADILYSYFNWSGAYSTGSLTDIGWNMAYLFIALGGFLQNSLVMTNPGETHTREGTP